MQPKHRGASPITIIGMMERHGITLPGNAIEWRARSYEPGGHAPLFDSVWLIATDGNLAWFLLGDRETIFLGQLKAFVPDEQEAKSFTGHRSAKTKPPTANQLKAQALANED